MKAQSTPPKNPKRRCPSCNDTVATTTIETNVGRELHCGLCGLTLDRAGVGQDFGSVERSDQYAKSLAESDNSLTAAKQLKPLIAVAEDSRLIRRIVSQHLQTRFPTAELLSCEDGQAAVEQLTRALLPGDRRGVAIFDLQMPKLSGVAAAVALRAVERALQRKPLPIIFFSAVRVNDKLKEAMTDATPASYLHKSDTENPENMLTRLEEVMRITIKRVYG